MAAGSTSPNMKLRPTHAFLSSKSAASAVEEGRRGRELKERKGSMTANMGTQGTTNRRALYLDVTVQPCRSQPAW
jgi:hypothetical protein